MERIDNLQSVKEIVELYKLGYPKSYFDFIKQFKKSKGKGNIYSAYRLSWVCPCRDVIVPRSRYGSRRCPECRNKRERNYSFEI